MDYCSDCGKPKWHSLMPSLSWKGKSLGLDIVSQNVPWKTNYWTNWSWFHFSSREVSSYTDTSYCIYILWEVCRSVFHGPPCIVTTALQSLLVLEEKWDPIQQKWERNPVSTSRNRHKFNFQPCWFLLQLLCNRCLVWIVNMQRGCLPLNIPSPKKMPRNLGWISVLLNSCYMCFAVVTHAEFKTYRGVSFGYNS